MTGIYPEILIVIDKAGSLRVVTDIAAHVRILDRGVLSEAADRHECAGGAVERAIAEAFGP